jgi:two-component system LytT family response regulator
MYSTLLLDKHPSDLLSLKRAIEKYCPCLDIIGQAETRADFYALLQKKKPDIVFLNPAVVSCDKLRENFHSVEFDIEIICLTSTEANALGAIQHQVSGFLFKPIRETELILLIEKAVVRIRERAEWNKDKVLLQKLLHEKHTGELIGIPTIEGYEFIFSHEIIRCEGLQKCTRVVTTTKTDIISSYNIGEFRKLLEPYHFFSPHKSHLINLAYLKKYRRDGTIILRDNANVPVSKRKKSEFLELVVHL